MKRFRYKKWVTLIAVFSLMAASWGCAIACFLTRGDKTSGEAGYFCLCFGLFLFFCWLTSLFFTSDVVITDKGIARSLGKRVWQFYGWDEIKEARVFVATGISTSRRRNVYCLYRTDGLARVPKRGMGFDEDIENSNELVELLNGYLAKYRIPILLRADRTRSAADAYVSNLPPPISSQRQ